MTKAVPVLRGRQPLGPQHRDRRARGSVGRASRRCLRVDRATSTRPASSWRSGSSAASRCRSTARRLDGDLLVAELNATAGARGIGRIDHVENRLVGIKSREIYEAPAAVTLHAAHHALESLTITRDVARFQRIVGDEWARLVYDGLWFSALRTALDAFVQETQVHVTGDGADAPRGRRRIGRRQARGALAVQQRPRDLRPRRRHVRPRRGARLHRAVRPAAAHADARSGSPRGHGTTARRAAHATAWRRLTGGRAALRAQQPQRTQGLGGPPERADLRARRALHVEPRRRPATRRRRRRRLACPRAHAAQHRRAHGRATSRASTRGCAPSQRSSPTMSLRVRPGDEDIHTAVERRLFELAGPVAGMLHTGRSRNDQVATDLRMWARRACTDLLVALAGLQEALVTRAAEHRTRTDARVHAPAARAGRVARASPARLRRDVRARCAPARRGACAAATSCRSAAARSPDRRCRSTATAWPTSSASRRVAANSMDAVADRDFVVEITAACALTMVHCSRLGEELVLWSSTEFGFASLPDSHATGSSLMPQKKNADVAELARGRSGRVIGDLVALLTVLKGLPLTYNRDLQEDKEPLFDAVDTDAAPRCGCSPRSSPSCTSTSTRCAGRRPTRRSRRPTSRSTSSPTACPFARRTPSSARWWRAPLADGRTLADLDLDEWQAASDRFDAERPRALRPRCGAAPPRRARGPGPAFGRPGSSRGGARSWRARAGRPPAADPRRAIVS